MKKICLFVFLWMTFPGYAQDRTDTLHVARYDLHLSVMDFATHTIDGYADVYVVPKIPNISHIILDLKALTVDSVLTGGAATTFTHHDDKLSIAAPEFQLGDTIPVRVYYHGTPARDASWGGFYFSGQYAYNMGVGFDDIPHNYGRVWFPCLDFFTDKSSYTIHVRTEAGKMAVCNGLPVDTATLEDSTRIWTWQLDEPVPTYLASLAVGTYQLYADTFHGMDTIIPITIYAQPNIYANVGASFTHLKQILRFYEKHFGPYRWPRVGYVLVNFNGGAMEHATNIAYPIFAVDGATTYELLYAHELFHHWFGNLITCSRAEEMWINEGFAAYSEALVDGLLNSTADTDACAAHIRELHDNTLRNIAKNDGGLYALDNVPQSVTYGTHSYDKGALVIHSLRQYMGDSLFFAGCRALLEHYAFENVSSEELFNYLSQASGMDLTDFYEGWVHQPGFLQFHIDSIRPADNGEHYRVYLHQKTYGGTRFANGNKVDLTFVSVAREMMTVENIVFSGEFGTVEVALPFEPLFGIVDMHDKLSDAVIDEHFQLSQAGTYSFPKLNCTLKAAVVGDTTFVRIEHNYVAPDLPDTLLSGLYRASQTHYWRVAMAPGITNGNIPTGQLHFKYQSGGAYSLDHDLMQGYGVDNLKLLYRPDAASAWRVVPAIRTGSPYSGTLKTDFIASGDYCLAIGDPTLNVEDRAQAQINLFPNPTTRYVYIRFLAPHRTRYKATLLDSTGRIVKTMMLRNGNNCLDLQGLPDGLYLVGIMDRHRPVQAFRLIKAEHKGVLP